LKNGVPSIALTAARRSRIARFSEAAGGLVEAAIAIAQHLRGLAIGGVGIEVFGQQRVHRVRLASCVGNKRAPEFHQRRTFVLG